ncbi:MAG: alpha/beta hydrolase [Propionibacteriaceae bacterium]|nr:alpha/beta hydrolase [Propionibacteriaceae bacterium]
MTTEPTDFTAARPPVPSPFSVGIPDQEYAVLAAAPDYRRRLDPALGPFVEYLKGDMPDVPIEVERAQSLAASQAQVGVAFEPAPAEVEIGRLWIPGAESDQRIMLKTYRAPTPDQPAEALRPGLLYIHGGGWCAGSADAAEVDAWCGQVAHEAGLVIASVEYRLAPEDKFPAGFLDCWAALEWVAANAELLGMDRSRLAVGGGSAGGNLSAAVALKAKAAGGPAIALQLLEMPALDFTLSSPSTHEFDADFPAVGQMVTTMLPRYLDDVAQAQDPYVSPLLAPDLTGLPRAAILICEIDPVRDDGLRYAERLRQAGVEVDARVYQGMLHGCSSLTLMLPSARAWRDHCVAALKTL